MNEATWSAMQQEVKLLKRQNGSLLRQVRNLATGLEQTLGTSFKYGHGKNLSHMTTYERDDFVPDFAHMRDTLDYGVSPATGVEQKLLEKLFGNPKLTWQEAEAELASEGFNNGKVIVAQPMINDKMYLSGLPPLPVLYAQVLSNTQQLHKLGVAKAFVTTPRMSMNAVGIHNFRQLAPGEAIARAREGASLRNGKSSTSVHEHWKELMEDYAALKASNGTKATAAAAKSSAVNDDEREEEADAEPEEPAKGKSARRGGGGGGSKAKAPKKKRAVKALESTVGVSSDETVPPPEAPAPTAVVVAGTGSLPKDLPLPADIMRSVMESTKHLSGSEWDAEFYPAMYAAKVAHYGADLVKAVDGEFRMPHYCKSAVKAPSRPESMPDPVLVPTADCDRQDNYEVVTGALPFDTLVVEGHFDEDFGSMFDEAPDNPITNLNLAPVAVVEVAPETVVVVEPATPQPPRVVESATMIIETPVTEVVSCVVEPTDISVCAPVPVSVPPVGSVSVPVPASAPAPVRTSSDLVAAEFLAALSWGPDKGPVAQQPIVVNSVPVPQKVTIKPLVKPAGKSPMFSSALPPGRRADGSLILGAPLPYPPTAGKAPLAAVMEALAKKRPKVAPFVMNHDTDNDDDEDGNDIRVIDLVDVEDSPKPKPKRKTATGKKGKKRVEIVVEDEDEELQLESISSSSSGSGKKSKSHRAPVADSVPAAPATPRRRRKTETQLLGAWHFDPHPEPYVYSIPQDFKSGWGSFPC